MGNTSSFPVQLAIRLLLDSVSYSNALPEWFDVLVIDYNDRARQGSSRCPRLIKI
jgi:hypothetical protein